MAFWLIFLALCIPYTHALEDDERCIEIDVPWDEKCYVGGCDQDGWKKPYCLENVTFSATDCTACFRVDTFMKHVAPWPLGVSLLLWVVDALIWAVFVAEMVTMDWSQLELMKKKDIEMKPVGVGERKKPTSCFPYILCYFKGPLLSRKRALFFVLITFLWGFKTVYRGVALYVEMFQRTEIWNGNNVGGLFLFPILFEIQPSSLLGSTDSMMTLFDYLSVEAMTGGVHVSLGLVYWLVAIVPLVIFSVTVKYAVDWWERNDKNSSDDCGIWCGMMCAGCLFCSPFAIATGVLYFAGLLRIVSIGFIFMGGIWPFVWIPCIFCCGVGGPSLWLLSLSEKGDQRAARLEKWSEKVSGREGYGTVSMVCCSAMMCYHLMVLAAMLGFYLYFGGEYDTSGWGVGQIDTWKWWLMW